MVYQWYNIETMSLYKRTYSIDANIILAFEQLVKSGNRSIVITELLKSFLSQKEREKIRQQIVDGSKHIAEFYQQESSAWNSLEEEAYGITDNSTSKRRYSASPARSGRGS